MNDIGFALRHELRAERDRLIAAFSSGGAVRTLLQGLSASTDRLLRRVVHGFGLQEAVAVIAVGGYGRGALFPHSDVDILILHDAHLVSAHLAQIEGLIGQLWDLGLQVGHSVRTVNECREEARRDVTVLTSMLESRLVSGPRRLYRELDAAIVEVLDSPAFFQAKVLEQQQRHTKFQDTPYSLEPNCKESPGGLRDLQIILWVARAAGFGGSWRGLLKRNLLTRDEYRMLIAKE